MGLSDFMKKKTLLKKKEHQTPETRLQELILQVWKVTP